MYLHRVWHINTRAITKIGVLTNGRRCHVLDPSTSGLDDDVPNNAPMIAGGWSGGARAIRALWRVIIINNDNNFLTPLLLTHIWAWTAWLLLPL